MDSESDEGLYNETILCLHHAKVIGAFKYTVQLSSSTIFLSWKDLLSVCGLLVVIPLLERTGPGADGAARAIIRAFMRFDLLEQPGPVALFMRYCWENSYSALKTFALGLLQAEALLGHQNPLVLIFDADIGRLAGDILGAELALEKEGAAIDEIELGALDFIDIGEEMGHTQTVPAVVKSLVFSPTLHPHHQT